LKLKLGIIDLILVGLIVVGSGVFAGLGFFMIFYARSINIEFLINNVGYILAGGTLIVCGALGLTVKEEIRKIIKQLFG